MIILAMLAGVSISVARIINANLASKTGIFEGVIFNYVVGLAFSLVFLFFSGENLSISSLGLSSVPWWVYTGGAIGVFVVGLSSYVAPKISAFYLTILIFVSQLFVATIIDYLRLNIFSIARVCGGLLVFAGLTYNLYLDKKAVLEIEEDL